MPVTRRHSLPSPTAPRVISRRAVLLMGGRQPIQATASPILQARPMSTGGTVSILAGFQPSHLR